MARLLDVLDAAIAANQRSSAIIAAICNPRILFSHLYWPTQSAAIFQHSLALVIVLKLQISFRLPKILQLGMTSTFCSDTSEAGTLQLCLAMIRKSAI